jgi:chromosome partitioning protein
VAKVISIISRKGGVGKTVTAIYCAQVLKARGNDVSILDKDPEGSARAWARDAVSFPYPIYPESKQDEALKHKWVVIDTPPNDVKALGDAARLANYVVVIAKCNSLEADRLIPTLDALAASGYAGQWGILLTQAKGNLGREMQDALEAEDLPVLGIIPHLIKFERAFGSIPDDLSDYQKALIEVVG